MVKMKEQVIILSIIFFLVLISGATVFGASNFDIPSMDFDAKLNSDGSMDVIETWNISMYGETNTVYKTFKIDKGKYSDIKDVRVYLGDTLLNREDEWMYHMTTDSYFAGMNNYNQFEIAWGVDKSSGKATYKVTYKVTDVVKMHNDCAELCWQFIGDEFANDIDKVTGTITLPSDVAMKDNLKVWLHGSLTGEIDVASMSTVTFGFQPYNSGYYVETRLAILDKDMFNGIINKSNNDVLDDIIAEETEWAEYSNELRDDKRRGDFVVSILKISVIVLLVWRIFFLVDKNKKTIKLVPTFEAEYWREIPDEEETPAGVGVLYEPDTPRTSNIWSATLLDLCLKKYFSVEADSDKKDELRFTIIEEDTSDLKESEKVVYELFKEVALENKTKGGVWSDTLSFTLRDFNKYTSEGIDYYMYKKFNSISDLARREQKTKGNYIKENWKVEKQISAYFIFEIFIFGFCFFYALGTGSLWLWSFTILSLIVIILNIKIFKKFTKLTQQGVDERYKLQKLKKFLDDFSIIDERETREVAVWEKYLVYATVFGNADKVLRELKIKYPEMFDGTTSFYDATYLNAINRMPNGIRSFSSISSSISRAYSGTIPSSSSYGGGYSSGGGSGGGSSSGGGGGRWWRPAAVVDNFKGG